MVNWDNIQNVLLDMDGTLLDLHYDNYFWREHLPIRYAEKHGIEIDEAKSTLFTNYKKVEGTIQWYCLDYWSDLLEMDIPILKEEVSHLIAVHPHVIDFLRTMRRSGKHTALVTNAHQGSLSLKIRETRIGEHLDAVISSHDLGLAKEEPAFWSKLQRKLPFDPASTLLIDDNLAVLDSAKAFGMTHLLAVKNPDSKQPSKACGEYSAIQDFSEILPSSISPLISCPSA